MTDKEKIKMLEEKNKHLLKEVSNMAAESLRREVKLAKLEAELIRFYSQNGTAERHKE